MQSIVLRGGGAGRSDGIRREWMQKEVMGA